MCFGAADSTAVIKTDVPLEQLDTTGKDPTKYNPGFRDGFLGADAGVVAPWLRPGKTAPNNIDLGDEKLVAARKAAKLRAAMGYGRSATFLTGASGDTSALKLDTPTLLGGG